MAYLPERETNDLPEDDEESASESGELSVPAGEDVEIPKGESMNASQVNVGGQVSVSGTMNLGNDDGERVKASGEPIANVSDVEELESRVRKWKVRGAISSVILFVLGWILPGPSEVFDLLISLI